MRRMSSSKRRQGGFSLIGIMIAVVIAASLSIYAIRAAQGQRADAEFSLGVQMVTVSVSEALTSYFYTNTHSYRGLSTASQALLISRYGVRDQMPWGDAWVIQAQSPAAPATPTTLTFRYTCSGLRAGCDEFKASIDAFNRPNDLIDNVALVGSPATAIDVRYRRPR